MTPARPRPWSRRSIRARQFRIGRILADGDAADAGPVDTSQSVLQRNKNASRDGHFVQPTLTKANAAKLVRDTGFTTAIAGGVWNTPLYTWKWAPGTRAPFSSRR